MFATPAEREAPMALFDMNSSHPTTSGGSSFEVRGLETDDRPVIQRLGRFSVIEYARDLSVAPDNAVPEYFMSKMGVRRRQTVIDLDQSAPVVLQAGAMQWMVGPIEATTGIKGVGDFLGKTLRGAVTSESAVKPEYVGQGTIVLEPTYKHVILVDVADWGPEGVALEDGMFLACDGSVEQRLVSRSTVSSALGGGEGLFNLALRGTGVAALESNVPLGELVEVNLVDDTLKVDGPLAVMWSAGLKFTVERSSKSLMGSAVTGEGLVNVFRGTGRVLMSPVAPTWSLAAATHS